MGLTRQGLDDWKTNRQAGHEVGIHHVDMGPVRVGNPLELPLEVCEVTGEDAG